MFEAAYTMKRASPPAGVRLCAYARRWPPQRALTECTLQPVPPLRAVPIKTQQLAWGCPKGTGVVVLARPRLNCTSVSIHSLKPSAMALTAAEDFRRSSCLMFPIVRLTPRSQPNHRKNSGQLVEYISGSLTPGASPGASIVSVMHVLGDRPAFFRISLAPSANVAQDSTVRFPTRISHSTTQRPSD